MAYILIIFCCLLSTICGAAVVQEKVLICGICKNVEKAVPNTIRSVQELGAQFLDYQVVIYENNSIDRTKELFQEWAKNNRHVIFISKDLPKKKMARELAMRVFNRAEGLARGNKCARCRHAG